MKSLATALFSARGLAVMCITMIKPFFVAVLTACLIASSEKECGAEKKYADLSGTWYRSSPAALGKELTGYLKRTRLGRIRGRIVSVISPHAGFLYSGGVAAFAFKALQQADPRAVIIVGFTHRRYNPRSVSVLKGSAFVTPLGEAEIDAAIAEKLIAFDPVIKSIPEAFDGENSVEMLIPFVQHALPGAKIVLVSMEDQGLETSEILAEALYQILRDDERVMAIASTDMSHRLRHKQAVKKDAETIKKIKAMDPDDFYRYSLDSDHSLMCGQGAVYAVMKASRKVGADKFEVLKYATSGDVTGEMDSVVGYLSAAFVRTKGSRNNFSDGKEEGQMFSTEEKRTLLGIARETMISYLRTGQKPRFDNDNDNLNSKLGGFVTLRQNGALRGCIGRMEGEKPFYLTVMDMAVAAAVEDPRFPKVSIEDMDGIDIEISALSPMKKIEDPSEIELGKHGVMVKRGARSGVYLPQVADETGWSLDEFMGSLCAHKAGIPENSWKTGDAEIFVYTAEVFGEKESGTRP